MFSTLDLTTKLPVESLAYILGWKPDRDARQWMKGQSPQWVPFAPFDVIAEKYTVPAAMKDAFCKRILQDSIERFDFDANPAHWSLLPATQPDFNFARPDGTWILAPQETTLAHLYWVFQQGHIEALYLACIQFLSYYNHGWKDKAHPETPTAWSQLRNGGDAKTPYLDAGRTRTARGCIDYPTFVLMMLRDLGIETGMPVDFLQKLLTEHVLRISNLWPLLDAPKGDHLPVPFMSVYQTASLWRILRTAAHITNDGQTRVLIATLAEKIQTLIAEFGPVPGHPAWWFYDIPFKDGLPQHGDPETAQINKGVAGVAAYLPPLLYGEQYAAMVSDAVLNKWPKLHPAETAWAFGTLDL